MRTCFAWWGIKAPLNHAASVTMAGHISYTRGNSLKHELGILWAQFQDDALDHVVSMRIDAKTSCGRCQCIHQDIRCRLSVIVFVQHTIFFILRTELHHLLYAPSAMKVQTCIHKTTAHALHQHYAFLGGDLLQNFLKKVVSKRVHHGFAPERQAFLENKRRCNRSLFVQRLLNQTAANLIAREATNLTQQGVQGWALRRSVQ
mmetsp:Transcript_26934/g.63100  ORF Transcript_26934/g.63100 Transcript_26934/m.63100 type:complete len:203 (-) Transcript_26934:2092-2700(-)